MSRGACIIYQFMYNSNLTDKEKPLIWIGSAKKDLMALPTDVRKFFGHALDFAQRGGQHDAAKTLKGFGGAGVVEHARSEVDHLRAARGNGDVVLQDHRWLEGVQVANRYR